MSELTSVLPNLSIGVIAVLSLVVVTFRFLDRMEKSNVTHEKAMADRENALRAVEKEVRTEFGKLLAQSNHVIVQSTHAIGENSKILARAVDRWDSERRK